MDRCPDEVLYIIFTLACSDDGATGRALSLLSHRIRNVSFPVRYRSVAVFGVAQIKAFTAILSNRPVDPALGEQGVFRSVHALPRVEHLLVSSSKPTQDVADDDDEAAPSNLNDETLIDDLVDHPDEEAKELALETWSQDAKAALSGLLAIIAPSLRTLFTNASWDAVADSPAPFPRLTALTASDSQKPFPSRIPCSSLTDIHLIGCWHVMSGTQRVSDVWNMLAASAFRSTLSHLRLSDVRFGDPAEYLRVQLDVPVDAVDRGDGTSSEPSRTPVPGAPACFRPGTASEQRASETAAMLPKLKHVWIQPKRCVGVSEGWWKANMLSNGAMLAGLTTVAEQSQKKKNGAGVLMVLSESGVGYGVGQLLNDWLSYIGGDAGPWLGLRS
ncbi:hypothetical protein PUNSTDRAFT_123008 [Punctularia strigosozonata HHB-11173 SS5]|uniref:Uncharacterized protein n=1 Tax=Punctularia strigosozonata (strain HHB-11173) TaxID=741275 RepID=R7S311_PUNST|nr:uncharacterized protein PUNSTDRAFT_123008 [Punctularia strigosozonata HHB-11173 SS5]EIN04219.1 hypothetical protein PUNSTDRAFT_123008 [Punctularia strigosozonata HHB-11173 SS5]